MGPVLLFCLLYMLRGGKQDTIMFLKYCDLYQGFVSNLREVMKSNWDFWVPVSGVSSTKSCAFGGREVRDFWNSVPPRSPFQESQILHRDFRNWATNNNLTKSLSNGFVLCWSMVEYSHKPQQPVLLYCYMGMGSCHGKAPVSLQPVWRESKGSEREKWVRFRHISAAIKGRNLDSWYLLWGSGPECSDPCSSLRGNLQTLFTSLRWGQFIYMSESVCFA